MIYDRGFTFQVIGCIMIPSYETEVRILMEKIRCLDKLRVMNRDLLKWSALLFMGLGHFFVYTAKEFHFFGIPSPLMHFIILMMYAAPPVFFFFIAEGYRYTHSKKNYFIRLLIMTLVTQIPYVLFQTFYRDQRASFDFYMFLTNWNVVATLLLGFLAVSVWDSGKHPVLKAAGILLCCVAGYFTEWSCFGVLCILLFYIFRERPVIRFAAYELLMLIYVLRMGGYSILSMDWRMFAVFSLPNIAVALFYNGKKGHFPKLSQYFFYFFYPAHLLLIYIVILLHHA